jgi:hypothetical protein
MLLGLVQFLLPLLALPGPAFACTDFAKAPNSRWRVESENGTASLVTPCGDPFFSIGVNGIDGGSRPVDGVRGYFWGLYEPTLTAWARRARERLLAWGFNTAGGWSLKPQILDMPATIELSLGRRVNFMWGDPFDPDLPVRVRNLAKNAIAPFKGDPRRIGYFSDNEIGWWHGPLFSWWQGPLFSAYTRHAASNHTKQRLIGFLRKRYGEDWQAFRRDFTPPEDSRSFDDLLRTRTATRIRPGGQGFSVVREWTRIVAEHYYRIMREAILAADPEALYLGDRLPIYYDPDAVRIMGKYVDVIATNYNADGPDGWIAQYYFRGLRQLAPKPVLVTEWFFAAHENRTGNLNRTGYPRSPGQRRPPSSNINKTGHLMTVGTQEERAVGAAAATEALAREPNVVGLHWFQFYDHPKGGRADGEDYNFGLVDVRDRPYEQLVAALSRANRLVSERRKETPRRSTVPAVPLVPYAAIDAQDSSLLDWPKAVALVPMQPAPDEPVFGDIYLSWDDNALNVAVIAMDYYDPHLMAWSDEFPRDEAFRLAIGIKQGERAHLVQLRVVPDSTTSDGGRFELRVRACQVERDACAEAPIAARFFGVAMDQPRVIFEAKVPWANFGGRPAVGTEVGLALSAISFYRSRWMSLSGEAPDWLMTRPTRWLGVKLGVPLPPAASPSQ